MHDMGMININGAIYNVIRVEKVGKCVLHYLDQEINTEMIN